MKQTSFSMQTLKSRLSSFKYDSDSLMKYELLIMKHGEIK